MKWVCALTLLLAMLAMPETATPGSDTGDPQAGRRIFGACVACHSLEPGRHLTGPSLANIWGRKAGTVEGFNRYSDALKRSAILWDGDSLDAWLANPWDMVPGNRMTFPGMPDQQQRRDLIAFLHDVAKIGGTVLDEPSGGMSRPLMGQAELLDLKTFDPSNRLTAIGLCGDTYTVTAETGEVYQFWEFNLRFKTDGSAKGPVAGHPVIIPGGMRGDRAFVVFASPAEISYFIRIEC